MHFSISDYEYSPLLRYLIHMFRILWVANKRVGGELVQGIRAPDGGFLLKTFPPFWLYMLSSKNCLVEGTVEETVDRLFLVFLLSLGLLHSVELVVS